MKLLFVITNLERAGAQRVLLNLCRSLVNEHVIEIVALRESEYSYDFSFVPIRILKNSENKSSKWFRFINYRNQLKHIIQKGKYDAVISFLPEPNFLCTSINHSGFTLINVRNDPKVEYKGIYHTLMKWFYPKADACIVQTNRNKDYFKDILKQVYVIKNPISPMENIECERKPIILSVGRMTAQKNHKMLLQAFSEFSKSYPEYECHIVGDGVLRKDIETFIETLECKDKIKLFKPNPDVFKHMAEADIFVLSSNYEGYPNVLLEAMASGCISIATRVGSGASEELIQEEINGFLVDVQDEKGLLDKLLYVKTLEFTDVIRENAKKVKNSHSEEEFIEQFCEVLERVKEHYDKN